MAGDRTDPQPPVRKPASPLAAPPGGETLDISPEEAAAAAAKDRAPSSDANAIYLDSAADQAARVVHHALKPVCEPALFGVSGSKVYYGGANQMPIPNPDCFAAALYYGDLGYRVIPCLPGTQVPLPRHGLLAASSDRKTIQRWWQCWPTANIAMDTEGLLVLDEKRLEQPWLADAPDKLLSLSMAPHADAASGGLHRLFRQPAGRAWRSTTGRLAPNVDTRAQGGMFLVEPSIVYGQAYRWHPALTLQCRPDQLPEPPTWLIAQLDLLDRDPDPLASKDVRPVPYGMRRSTLAHLAGSMRRAGLVPAEILAAMHTANRNRCVPPLADEEVVAIVRGDMRYAPETLASADLSGPIDDRDTAQAGTIFTPALQLCAEHRELRRPVIHGLLRESEIMNVIATPKAGKSWLVLHLALAIGAGDLWLGYPTQKGNVLLIDNELHPETLANRIPRVAHALSMAADAWKDRFFVHNLRGELRDLYHMEAYFHQLPSGFFKVIILDAFYRFLPKDADENDNGAVTHLYNILDRHALRLGCAFVLVHHTSKGYQAGRGVTDVGAGAGSQARATDAHFILREHAEPKCLSVDAVARSWPPPVSFVIRQKFPIWRVAPTLNPTDLKRPERRSKKSVLGQAELPLNKKIHWTTDLFLKRFISQVPRTKAEILEMASAEDLKEYRAEKLLRRCEDLGKVYRWTSAAQAAHKFATVPQSIQHEDPPTTVQNLDSH